jgi:hypothetical protein
MLAYLSWQVHVAGVSSAAHCCATVYNPSMCCFAYREVQGARMLAYIIRLAQRLEVDVAALCLQAADSGKQHSHYTNCGCYCVLHWGGNCLQGPSGDASVAARLTASPASRTLMGASRYAQPYVVQSTAHTWQMAPL